MFEDRFFKGAFFVPIRNLIIKVNEKAKLVPLTKVKQPIIIVC
jgi:hypothetical protein